MIGGTKKAHLTIEEVLRRVSEYEIFRFYMGNIEWKLNNVCISPFPRTTGYEQHPSFLISNRSGNIHFIDFGDTDKKGDCFTFVKLLYNLSTIDEVLKKIDSDLSLGIRVKPQSFTIERARQLSTQPQDVKEKQYVKIQAVVRPFTQVELKWWAEYHIDLSDLRREKVYAIKKIYLNRQLFLGNNTEFIFGYLYDEKWKIYRPLEDKRSKWVPNNVPITAMDGKDRLSSSEKAFINKSKKDYMVIQKLFPFTCAVQNESIGCFSEENVKFLKSNSKEQILSFDSDIPGVNASLQITAQFGFGYCNVPRVYLSEGIKDWADLAKKHGMKVIEDYLKQKQII